MIGVWPTSLCANHFLDYNALWEKCFLHAAANVQPLFSSETSWLGDTSFPRCLTSCHSNYLQSQLWASLKAPGELYLCHSQMNLYLCKPAIKNHTFRSQQKGTCTHMYAEKLTWKWQHIHMYTQTHMDQRQKKNTCAIQTREWQADRQKDRVLLWQMQLCF